MIIVYKGTWRAWEKEHGDRGQGTMAIMGKGPWRSWARDHGDHGQGGTVVIMGKRPMANHGQANMVITGKGTS